MPSKPFLIAILGFWALSIIGSPLAWLYQSEETIAITMNTAEEESGKTVKVDPLEEKLIIHNLMPYCENWAFSVPRPGFGSTNNESDFIGEILLPPPEAGRLA